MPWKRQETRRPLARRDRLLPARPDRGQHDETRQILRLGAEPVQQPRTHARPALDRRAGVHEGVRRIVVDLIGVQRLDHAQLVGDAAEMRKDFRDLQTRCAALPERAERPHCVQRLVLQLRQLLALGE
jgi:hypothetical protein